MASILITVLTILTKIWGQKLKCGYCQGPQVITVSRETKSASVRHKNELSGSTHSQLVMATKKILNMGKNRKKGNR